MKKLIILIILLAGWLSLSKPADAQQKRVHRQTRYSYLYNQDTTPPDTFTTAPQFVFVTPNQDTIKWNPSEIEATDVDTLRFDFSGWTGISPTSLSIPWTTASVDSDTVVNFAVSYGYTNDGAGNGNFKDNTVVDTNEVLSIVTTLIDNSNNSQSMTAITELFYIYTEDYVVIDSAKVGDGNYSGEDWYHAYYVEGTLAAANNTWDSEPRTSYIGMSKPDRGYSVTTNWLDAQWLFYDSQPIPPTPEERYFLDQYIVVGDTTITASAFVLSEIVNGKSVTYNSIMG